MKMDALTRRVLGTYAMDPAAGYEAMAANLNVEPVVVRDRIERLQRDGVLHGLDARIDASQVGYPYEAFILAVPSPQTTRTDLEKLAASPLVTRMFTLATRRSIAFTVLGTGPDAVCQHGEALAEAAGLEDVAAVMLVDTMADHPGGALGAALGTPQQKPANAAGSFTEPLAVRSQETA